MQKVKLIKHDVTTKEAIKTIAEDIAIYILELDIKDVEFIDKELLFIEKREADIVAKCKIDNSDALLHLEIQNSNDINMHFRMLRYYIDIKKSIKIYPSINILYILVEIN